MNMASEVQDKLLANKKAAMKKKRKRAPGGGRKPSGPFAQNAASLTIRISTDLRAQLETAAKKKGRSLSQEMQARLWKSLGKDPKDHNDPATRAMRALCFLFSETADKVHFGLVPEWSQNRFLFRAFKLAVEKVLDTIEPIGEIKSPLREVSEKIPPRNLQLISDRWTSPETAAEKAAEGTIDSLFLPAALKDNVQAKLRELNFPERPDISDELIKEFQREFYNMLDARRDLGIDKLVAALTEPKS
jgi:hypothetical protein